MNKRGISVLWVLFLIVLPMVLLVSLWRDPLSAGEDDVLYYYPLRVQVGRALARGEWPIVDPLTAGGTAVLGDPQAAVFFPATWLFAVLPPRLAYSLSIFAAFAVAGTGMWAYLRRLGLPQPAAAFGAVAFLLSGFFVAHRVHLSMIQTAAFFPWGLWSLELLRGRNPADSQPPPKKPNPEIRIPPFLSAFVAMVPIGSLALLAGHWPTVIHMMLGWGAYGCFRVRPLLRRLPAVVVAGAVILALTAPQWSATLETMRQATRAKISYATAGENSYFPLSALLWLFPFLFGSRWPNFFYPQPWWGPWHLCETLGYVGLITLVLAAATIGTFFRRRAWTSVAGHPVRDEIIRVWTWICLGAGVFMLGYYLPIYWLIYRIPVLGWVRCPSRMLLVLGAGLAILAATGLEILLSERALAEALAARVQNLSRRVLPMTMILSLAGLGILALLTGWFWPEAYPWPMNGSWHDAIRAIAPTNPAVWIPLATAGITAMVVGYWLRKPTKRWAAPLLLLLADLSAVVPFVDAPRTAGPGPCNPEVSPAAAWLREHAPKNVPWRVWGLGDPYGRRQAELLLPRTNVIQGIASLSTYGPFQTPAHAERLGFEIYGTHPHWQEMLARGDRLSAWGVRYLLVEAGGKYERSLRKILAQPNPPNYVQVAAVRAVQAGDADILIFENRCPPMPAAKEAAAGIGFVPSAPNPGWWLRRTTLPGGIAYLLALTGLVVVGWKERFRGT